MLADSITFLILGYSFPCVNDLQELKKELNLAMEMAATKDQVTSKCPNKYLV